MSRLCCLFSAVVTIFAFAVLVPASYAAAPVPPNAGKAVTFPYPAKAPVVVQLHGVGAALDRFDAMLKNALPNDAPKVKKQLDEGLKQLLAGRKLTAIPKDGRVFLVIHDLGTLAENTPAVSVLVPVTSYKEFRETFLTAEERKTFEAGKNGVDELRLSFLGDAHSVYAVDLKEYVAISPDKGSAEMYSIKYTKATSATMAPELATTFLTADFTVYVNLDVINEKYGEQIRAVKGLLDFAFMQAPMGGMLPGVSKKQLQALKVMLQGAFQAVEDCHGLVIGAEFRPEGVNLRLQAQFAEDTASVKLLKAETPTAMPELAKLPAGLGQYTGSKLGAKLSETVRGLTPEFNPADDDEKSNEAVDKQWKELLAAGPRGDFSASGAPAVTLTVGSYAEPKKAVAALVGCYEAMSPGGRVQNVVLKNTPKGKANAQKHAGFTFTELNLQFDFDASVKDLPPEVKETTLAQLKRLVAEKMSVWIGTDGQSVIQLMAKDWDTGVDALDKYLDGKKTLGETAGYKLTRKNLPPDANMIVLLETAQTARVIVDTLRALEAAVPDFPKIGKLPAFKGEPTFIGIAVTLKGDVATANLFIPGTSIAAAQGLLRDLFKQFE